MNTLLPLLAAYFACDAAAETRYLSLSEVQTCAAIYEEVKIAFLTEAERSALTGSPAERHRTLLTGYLRLQDWAEANPEAVKELRASDGGLSLN